MRECAPIACLLAISLAKYFHEYLSSIPDQGESHPVLCPWHFILFSHCGDRGHHHGDRQPQQLTQPGLLGVWAGVDCSSALAEGLMGQSIDAFHGFGKQRVLVSQVLFVFGRIQVLYFGAKNL